MAQQNGGKPEAPKRNKEYRVLLLLRLVAFLATASATIVMALNKQTNTLVVATIGNTPVKATLTAKFQHTPAFVLVSFSSTTWLCSWPNLPLQIWIYNLHFFFFDTFRFFVIANGMASVHSLTVIVVEIFGHKIDYKGLRLAIIAILDMVLSLYYAHKIN